jgi:O-antigen ligase
MVTDFNKITVLLAALLVPLLFTDYLWFPAATVLLILLILVYGKPFVLSFVVISFLTVTSTISPTLRTIIQLMNTSLLLYYFIKNRENETFIFTRVPKEILWLVSSILFLMFVSSVFSDYTALGFQQTTRSVIFFVIIYLLYTQLKSAEDIRVILKSLSAAAVFYSGFLFYELYMNNFQFISIQQQLTQIYGMEYLNKNYLGGFFSVMILLMVSLWFKPGVNKKLMLLLLIVMFFGLVMVNSRAALLSFFIALPILLYQLNRKVFNYIIITAVVILLLIVISPVLDYILLYFRLERIATGRDVLIEATANVIANNFWLGAGPAAAKYEMYNNLSFMLGSMEELFLRRNFNMGESGQAHSFYLFYFSDLGIFGFLLSLAFPVLYFKLVNKIISHYNHPGTDEYYLIRGLLAAGIFIFIRGIFEPAGIFSFGFINQDLLFWILISVIAFYYLKIPSDAKEKSPAF